MVSEKGLCDNCVERLSCKLTQKFPVWACEEHSAAEVSAGKTKKVKVKKKK